MERPKRDLLRRRTARIRALLGIFRKIVIITVVTTFQEDGYNHGGYSIFRKMVIITVVTAYKPTSVSDNGAFKIK